MHDQRKKASPVAESEEERRQRLAKAAKTGALYTSVLRQRCKRVYSQTALEATAALLKLVPEAYTVYNYRREILQSMHGGDQCRACTAPAASASPSSTAAPASWLLAELELNSATLMKDYKIYAAFTHRDWIMAQLLHAATAEAAEQASTDGDDAGNSEDARRPARALLLHVIACEMRQCEQLLRLDERNFHAWNYRRRTQALLQRVMALGAPAAPRGMSVLFSPEEQAELDFTTASINRNFSNYSAWHQRGMTIQSALRRSGVAGDARDVGMEASVPVVQELVRHIRTDMELLAKAVFCDPNDQAAWFYAPFLFNLCGALRRSGITHLALEGASPSRAEAQAGVCNQDALVACASIVDTFVHTTIDLLAEEASLGDEECHLPFYFLLSLFACLASAARATDEQARQRLMHYCAILNVKVFTQVTHAPCEEGNVDATDTMRCCIEQLYRHLVLVDPMRAGLYEHLCHDALC